MQRPLPTGGLHSLQDCEPVSIRALSAAGGSQMAQCTSAQPIQWQEYLWDPARLDAWLHEANTEQPPVQEKVPEQSPVPQHLRQLLLLLLQGAADTGKGQDLIWTPERLSGWLADNTPGSSSTCIPAPSTDVPSPAVLSSFVQLLPLVSNVAASKALAAESAGSPSSSSGQAPLLAACHASQPSSSAHLTVSCAGNAQSQLMGDELTSPDVHQQQQYQQLDTNSLSPDTDTDNDWQQYSQQNQQQQHEQAELSMHTCCSDPGQASCQMPLGQAELPAADSHQQQEPLVQLREAPQQVPQQQAQLLLQQLQLLQAHAQAAQQGERQLQQQQQQLVQQGDAPQQLPQQQAQLLLQQLQLLQAHAQAVQQGQSQLLQAHAQAVQQGQSQLLGAAAAGSPAGTIQETAGRPGMPRKEALPGDYQVVEDNAAWDPAAFNSSAAAAAASLGLLHAHSSGGPSAGTRSASDAVGPSTSGDNCHLRSSNSGVHAPRFGVLMLVHEKGVTAADVWEAWEGAHGGKVVVRLHLKAGVSIEGLPGEAWVSSRQLPCRIASKWGCISLAAAILVAAADMLQQHPQLQHVALVSGQDLPVATVPRDLRPGLSLFGRFQFGQVFDDAARQVTAEVLQQQLGMSMLESKAWGDALVFHHTWMVLDRQLLLALISKQEELLRVGTVLNARFMQPDVAVAADEFILITAAMRYGFVKQVVQRKLQTHMAAVRRQHRQQAPATAGQPHQPGEACEEERPTKQQRSRSQTPHGAVGNPAAGSQHAGSRRSSASTAAGSSGSRPGSRSSSRDSSATRVGACVAAVAGPLMDDSSGGSSAQQQGSRGRRVTREQGDGAAGVPPEELVGRSIKVWWELDQAFYRGNVTYYSHSTRRHTVKYEDGDVEIINLSTESWKLEGPPPAPAKGPPAPCSSSGRSISPLQDGTFGVLLDCCPTLALFHPTQTRHPREWRNFSECQLVDVNSHRPGDNKLTLLDALGLVTPNSALFFRKVAQMQRQGPMQLLSCLKLLWKGKPLPVVIEDVPME